MSRGEQRSDEERRLGLLSVVIPCFDEEAVVGHTHASLVEAMQSLPDGAFELIYVDDGSRDGTLAALRQLSSSAPFVRVLALSRNFGQQVAVTAGLEHARGDAVVVIDADMQDPPEVIPEMVARWRQGMDVVYGVRNRREHETAFKRWSAAAFYRLINHVSDIQIPLDAGDFRLMDRRVIDALLAMPERDRFVRGMVAWVGYRQEPVYYDRAGRHAGVTKYPLRKMLHFAADGIF